MSTRNAMMPVALSVPGANLGAYMTTVNSIPVLTADEERVLAERYVNDNDVDAARQLVLSHLRFVVHIAKSFFLFRSKIHQLFRIIQTIIGISAAHSSLNIYIAEFLEYLISREVSAHLALVHRQNRTKFDESFQMFLFFCLR